MLIGGRRDQHRHLQNIGSGLLPFVPVVGARLMKKPRSTQPERKSQLNQWNCLASPGNAPFSIPPENLIGREIKQLDDLCDVGGIAPAARSNDKSRHHHESSWDRQFESCRIALL